MGSIQSTGVEEDACGGDTSAGKQWEVCSLSKIDLTTLSRGDVGVGSGIEVELEVDGSSSKFLLEVCEAGDGVGLGQELGNETCRSR